LGITERKHFVDNVWVTFRGLKKHLCDLAQQKRLKARKSESEARREAIIKCSDATKL
jgi:hypothetical protein